LGTGAPVASRRAGSQSRELHESGGDIFANGLTLSCDPSCTGGSPVTRGTVCQQIPTARRTATSNASVRKCIGTREWSLDLNGDRRQPQYMVRQRGIQRPGGDDETVLRCQKHRPKCDVASCASPGVCRGAVPPDLFRRRGQRKLCCQTAAGATCAIRDPTVHLRVVDYGTIQWKRHIAPSLVAGTRSSAATRCRQHRHAEYAASKPEPRNFIIANKTSSLPAP
jgi:hypothetical protein